MEATPFYRRPVCLLSAFVIIGAITVWILFFRSSTPRISSSQAQEVASEFLSQIRAGHTDDAWKSTSSDFKSMWGQSRFRAFVKSKPMVTSPVEFATCEFKKEGNLQIAECRFRATSGKGTILVTLHPNEGRWRVGRLAVE